MPTIKSSDQVINPSNIAHEFRQIAALKAWQAYHTPKNLAAAVVVEASELLAEFQWLTPEQSFALASDHKQRVASEVADVVMYLCALCEQSQIDMVAAIRAKIEFNKQRFTKES